MRLVLQRGIGDCGLAALATLTEQSYEDVFIEAAKVDRKRRGKSGLFLTTLVAIAKRMGIVLVQTKPPASWDDTDGLLMVTWAEGSRHEVGTAHLVALADGVVVDPFDGLIVPPDEYLAREKAVAGAFLELR